MTLIPQQNGVLVNVVDQNTILLRDLGAPRRHTNHITSIHVENLNFWFLARARVECRDHSFRICVIVIMIVVGFFCLFRMLLMIYFQCAYLLVNSCLLYLLRASHLAFRLEQHALALRAHFCLLDEINSVHFARAMHIVLLILWLC